jgi:cystathionine beta-lyase
MLVLSSPHNPGGRVWTGPELEAIRDFCIRHDLVLVSDEIHHDLVFPGVKHTPFALVEGVQDRLIMMTSTTKTFNIAGIHTGNVIIPDPDLRKAFAGRLAALGISGNSFGFRLAEAAYSPEGAAWVDDLVAYLDGNRRLFDEAVNAIPGLASMPLESTYLAWVDFSGTGMPAEEITRRVQQEAKIAVNHGPTFGKGGENFLRFNFATPRGIVEDAVARLGEAFSDLQ